MLDERSRKVLIKIVNKEPFQLRKDERGFLRARKTYLTQSQKKKFLDILQDNNKQKTKQSKIPVL